MAFESSRRISEALEAKTITNLRFADDIDGLAGEEEGFFLLTMFAKDPTGCFSHRCVEGGDH